MELNPLNLQTFETFISFIKRTETSQEYLKIYCLFTKLKEEEIIRSLSSTFNDIKKIGQFIVFRYPSTDDNAEIYAYLREDTNLLFFFSFGIKNELDLKIKRFVNRCYATYFLWIEPKMFKEIKDKILMDYPESRIIVFRAKREPYYNVWAKIRPEVSRYIHYGGEDGTDALREMEYTYGVLPTSIQLEIPELINFSMDYRNTFVLYKGNENIDMLFEIIGKSLRAVSEKIKIFESARFNLVKEKINEKEIELLEDVPFYIKLTGKISEEEINYFFEKIEEEENYCVMSPVIQSGSLYFSATLLDGEKSRTFSISGDSKVISILPRGKSGFDVFWRFYESVIAKLDEKAECSQEINGGSFERREDSK